MSAEICKVDQLGEKTIGKKSYKVGEKCKWFEEPGSVAILSF